MCRDLSCTQDPEIANGFRRARIVSAIVSLVTISGVNTPRIRPPTSASIRPNRVLAPGKQMPPTTASPMWPNVPSIAAVALLAVAIIVLQLPPTTAATMTADTAAALLMGGTDGSLVDGRIVADEMWRHQRAAERRRRQQRVRRADTPLDSLAWLNLRRYVCGGDADWQCLTDERYVC